MSFCRENTACRALAVAPRTFMVYQAMAPKKTALFVEIPESEALISPYRKRPGWDAGSLLQNPAHITITIPFVPPHQLTDDIHTALSEISASTTEIDYSLTEIHTFESALWLRPEPEQPFRTLVHNVLKRFPDYPPFGGRYDVVQPHVTLALHVSEKERLQEMRAVAEREVGPKLPLVGCKARCMALYICDENLHWSLCQRYSFTKCREAPVLEPS